MTVHIISGNHTRGKAMTSDPAEAWDFKMEKILEGAKTTAWEKTTHICGSKTLCEPRVIYIKWSF